MGPQTPSHDSISVNCHSRWPAARQHHSLRLSELIRGEQCFKHQTSKQLRPHVTTRNNKLLFTRLFFSGSEPLEENISEILTVSHLKTKITTQVIFFFLKRPSSSSVLLHCDWLLAEGRSLTWVNEQHETTTFIICLTSVRFRNTRPFPVLIWVQSSSGSECPESQSQHSRAGRGERETMHTRPSGT